MVTLSDKAILEVAELSSEAERLARGSGSERKRADILVQRIAAIRQVGLSSSEMRLRYANALSDSLNKPNEVVYEKRFLAFITGGPEPETRDLLAGTQTISATTGPEGGYSVPVQFEGQVFEAMREVDPVLNPDVTDFTVEKTPTLQPKQLSGYDLSTIEAALIGETVQQTDGTFPTVSGRVLRGDLIYKLSIADSWEAEEDVPAVIEKFTRAYGVGFARRLGADAILGNGTTQPQGIYTAAPASGVTLGSGNYAQAVGNVTHEEIAAVFFNVNRAYRALPRCGWLMPDSVYQAIRNAVDGNGRPLIAVSKDDTETLFGKPVYISPSLPGIINNANASLAQNGALLFGDLGHFHVRCSRPTIQRVLNSTVFDITKGLVGYVGRVRMDSALFDPSGGAAPPIVSAVVQHT
jgi:HK97 family phage major capsid protein